MGDPEDYYLDLDKGAFVFSSGKTIPFDKAFEIIELVAQTNGPTDDIVRLIRSWGKMGPGREYAVRDFEDDAKIQELFIPHIGRSKVAIYGSARTAPNSDFYDHRMAWKQTFELGRAFRRFGWMVITGGGEGNMGAARRGVGEENHLGVGIKLPHENPTHSGNTVVTQHMQTRQPALMRQAHAAVATFPGRGTLSEVGDEWLWMIANQKTPHPLVLLNPPNEPNFWHTVLLQGTELLLKKRTMDPSELRFVTVVNAIEEVVSEVLNFYRNFAHVNSAPHEHQGAPSRKISMSLRYKPTMEDFVYLADRHEPLFGRRVEHVDNPHDAHALLKEDAIAVEHRTASMWHQSPHAVHMPYTAPRFDALLDAIPDVNRLPSLPEDIELPKGLISNSESKWLEEREQEQSRGLELDLTDSSFLRV